MWRDKRSLNPTHFVSLQFSYPFPHLPLSLSISSLSLIFRIIFSLDLLSFIHSVLIFPFFLYYFSEKFLIFVFSDVSMAVQSKSSFRTPVRIVIKQGFFLAVPAMVDEESPMARLALWSEKLDLMSSQAMAAANLQQSPIRTTHLWDFSFFILSFCYFFLSNFFFGAILLLSNLIFCFDPKFWFFFF